MLSIYGFYLSVCILISRNKYMSQFSWTQHTSLTPCCVYRVTGMQTHTGCGFYSAGTYCLAETVSMWTEHYDSLIYASRIYWRPTMCQPCLQFFSKDFKSPLIFLSSSSLWTAFWLNYSGSYSVLQGQSLSVSHVQLKYWVWVTVLYFIISGFLV